MVRQKFNPKSYHPNPYAPCMVYLPTFGWFLGQMLVNIPYIEHMGKQLSNTSQNSGFIQKATVSWMKHIFFQIWKTPLSKHKTHLQIFATVAGFSTTVHWSRSPTKGYRLRQLSWLLLPVTLWRHAQSVVLLGYQTPGSIIWVITPEMWRESLWTFSIF